MKKVAAPPPPPLKPSFQKNDRSSHAGLMTTGEESAFDELLEGCLDLDIVLPDCSRVRMTVDRRMAIMDLLVQVATANKLSPGSHIISVGSKDESGFHYKPNTPIGSLDTNTVYIIPKPAADLPLRKMPKLANQPFEQQTFRLQVNLPRNQRMVMRVSPHSTLAEVKQQICTEKELNHSTHHLVHPTHPETVLDLNSTLEIYGYAEISLMSNSSLRDSIRSTSTNFIAYQRPEEEKRKKGILGLFSRKKKGMSLDASSNGVSRQDISPARSEVSVRSSYQPKQSTKRKPAPAPPPVPAGPSPSPPLVIQCAKAGDSQAESEVSVKTDEMGSTVSHSRHSSDSSGYHEPSVFSDCSENKSPDASVVHGSHSVLAPESPRPKHREMHSQKRSSTPVKETSNVNSVGSHSSVSVSSTLRKRKAPQPPVPPPLPEALKESPTSETIPLVAEVTALNLTENVDVFEAPPLPAADEKSVSNGNACQEIVRHHPVEPSDVTVCDSTIPAFLNAAVSTETQPCSSSCSEDAPVLEGSDDQTAGVTGHLSPLDVQSQEITQAEEPDSSSQRNIDCHVEPPLEETIGDTNVLPGYSQVQHCKGLHHSAEISSSEVEATRVVLDTVVNEQLDNQQPCNVISAAESQLIDCEVKGNNLCSMYEEEEASSGTALKVPTLVHSQSSKEACMGQNSVSVVNDTDHLQSTGVLVPPDENRCTSQEAEAKLPNFTLGCYKTINEDIYDSKNLEDHASDIAQVKKPNDLSQNIRADGSKCDTSVDFVSSRKDETSFMQKRKALDVKIISFKEREKEDLSDLVSKGQVQEKRAQFIGLGPQQLGGRSASLHNLTPKKKVVTEIISSEDNVDSGANGLYRTQSDQHVAQENPETDEKQAAFAQEQKRLYEEYQKLQAQFISWQKQLMNNQSLLQSEQIMPKIVFPSFDGIQSNVKEMQGKDHQDDGFTSSLSGNVQRPVHDVEEAKPHPFPLKEPLLTQQFSLPLNCTETSEAPTCKTSETAHVAEKEKSPESSLIHRTAFQNDSLEQVQEISSDHAVVKDRTSPEVIYEEVKSQTLPRPKPKPLANGAFVESRTMTLNRHSRPKSQVVSITIGSWQQRNEPVKDIDSSNVASVRSKFKSLENISQGQSKPDVSVPQELTKLSTSVASQKKSPTSNPPVSDKVTDVNVKISQSVGKEKHPKSLQKADLSKHAPRADKFSKTDILSQSRYPKPLIRLTSMKDDFHLPSLRTCNKWPLGEMNQKETMGPDPMRDELKTSTRASSGSAREKIHRAEVDLRHHSKRDGKVSSESHTKHKEVDLRRVSSKSEPGWTQKQYKESDLRQSKSETIPSGTKSLESCSKSESLTQSAPSSSQVSSKGVAAVRPTSLHIATVTVHSENAQATTPEVKSPQTSKPFYGTSKYEGTESKLRTMEELKSVLAQKTAMREANKKLETGGPGSSDTPVNGLVPPAPPASAMPVIPPAEPIPVSSQLVMGKQSKSSTTAKQENVRQPKMQESKDPREELMLEIRGFGGRQALHKVPVTQASWHLKVFGPATPSLNSS